MTETTLLNYLIEHGISQAHLARKLGIAKSTFNLKAHGRIGLRFSDEQKQDIAEWLGRPVSELFPETESVIQEAEQA